MTMDFRHFVTRIANPLGVVALLTSCAPDPNLPTAEMTEAQKAIEQAEKAGARRFAQPDYEEAQAAYKQAEDAHRHGDHALATVPSDAFGRCGRTRGIAVQQC
jgi:hypothetical protein